MRLLSLMVSAAVLLATIGCGSPKVEPEPQASQQMGSESASKWTEEQKAAFAKAHEEARNEGK